MGYSWGVDVNQRPGDVRPLWIPPYQRREDDAPRGRVWPFVLLAVAVILGVLALVGDGGGQAAPSGPYVSVTTPDARPSRPVVLMGRVPTVPVQIVTVGG